MYKQWSEFKENMNNQIAFRTQIEFKQTAEWNKEDNADYERGTK
jgi:hypothetical protein